MKEWVILDVDGTGYYSVTGEKAEKSAKDPVYSSAFERNLMGSFRRSKRASKKKIS